VSTDLAAPIRKETVVTAAPELAFHIFTAEIDRWWPTLTHSVGGKDVVGVSIDGRVGGLVAEATRDGQRHVWGSVRLWDPPRRAVFAWHPGRPATDPTELELRFEPVDGGTRLVLEHRGWDRVAWHGERASYEPGWDAVIARFVSDVAGHSLR
jgi:hypothetical protein